MKTGSLTLFFHLFFLFFWILILVLMILPLNQGQPVLMSFLNPRYWWPVFLTLAFFVLFLGYFIQAYLRKKIHIISTKKGIGMLFLLLPGFFLSFALESTLGVATLENRGITTTLAAPAKKDSSPTVSTEAVTGDITRDIPGDEDKIVAMYEVVAKQESYIGKKVKVLGMYYSADDIPEGYFFLFRFVTSCCAADAVPLGLIIETADTTQYNDEDWLEVEGIVQLVPMAGQEYVGMKSPKITPAQKPPAPLEFVRY